MIEKQLIKLLEKYKNKSGGYDCLVPGSGKDSFYAAHILKYDMNESLTVTWLQYIYTDWGYKNFQSWIMQVLIIFSYS